MACMRSLGFEFNLTHAVPHATPANLSCPTPSQQSDMLYFMQAEAEQLARAVATEAEAMQQLLQVGGKVFHSANLVANPYLNVLGKN